MVMVDKPRDVSAFASDRETLIRPGAAVDALSCAICALTLPPEARLMIVPVGPVLPWPRNCPKLPGIGPSGGETPLPQGDGRPCE